MPKGPQGQKRPADVIGNAVRVMKIATGEIEETRNADDGKDPKVVERGRRGAQIRASNLTPEKRKAIAKRAAAARWRKK